MEKKRMRISDKALLSSLIIYHVWGFFLIARDTDISEKMFTTVCFGIFTTLGILAGEKTLRLLVELKWGKPSANPSGT